MTKYKMNIQDTGIVKQGNSSQSMQDHFNRFISETRENIRYEEKLIERAKEKIRDIEEGWLNLGRVFVKKVPAEYRLPYMNAQGDDYGDVIFPEESKKLLVSEYIPAFLEARIVFEESGEKWYLTIKQEYTGEKWLQDIHELIYVPEHYSMTIIMDQNEEGNPFNSPYL